MNTPTNDEIRRIACEQLDKGLRELADEEIDIHETIHQVRKRCKKLRGLIRLARSEFEKTYQRENTQLRDMAARLSPARDSEAVLETFDKLVESPGEETPSAGYSWIRLRLLEARDQVVKDEQELAKKLEAFRCDIVDLRERVSCWSFSDQGFGTIKGGLRKSYARGRKAMNKALHEPTSERFHEWRKRAKYHRYHMGLLQDIWKRPMKARRKELHTLSDLLGFEHDLAVLDERLKTDPEHFPESPVLEEFRSLIEKRRGLLRGHAFNLGKRLYSEKPKRLSKRFGDYWQAERRLSLDTLCDRARPVPDSR